ncbi:hypothetical protein [Plantibacter sp. CFBP 8804]|uniref:hypothetical protein n=1 Tax=Plantibacter sp. CFBP 8804 TaxID=2775270 RepID=UPI001A930BB0|nr:hypothetical protein [Plantibacter sp. CFBP 8804]
MTIDASRWREVGIGAALSAARVARRAPVVALLLDELGQPPSKPHKDAKDYAARVVEFRRHVVSAYRIAISQDYSPPQAVADHFGVSPTTATRWIAEVRRAGLLAGSHQDERRRTLGGDGYRPRDASSDSPGTDPRTGRSRGKTTAARKALHE